jgi:hypothetical protein
LSNEALSLKRPLFSKINSCSDVTTAMYTCDCVACKKGWRFAVYYQRQRTTQPCPCQSC